MSRKPIFWVLLCAISIAGVIFTIAYFPMAFPLVSLDIRMDRAAALAAAREQAARLELGPEDYAQATTFGIDGRVQSFVELEGGGAEAFRHMLQEGLYSAYTWRVRHFREQEANETDIWFTPAGDPYGFRERLAEEEPGAALAAADARLIAEAAGLGDWGVDLSDFELAEQSQETRPGGRIDHTFVYERSNAQVGEGRYRLRLVVSGDKLTELRQFVRVPEAFSRRYAEMRSANNTIGAVDSAVLLLLYVLGGCGVGLFLLLRQRWVIWKTPVLWGVSIAFLQLLVFFNQLPLAWISYDTALTQQAYLLQQIALALVIFLGNAFLFSVSFMAAESLTRRAFPHHIQLWRVWSPSVANSTPVLGRTLAGYLLVGVFFGYEVLVYRFANSVLGWWSPADALVQPDVLATYFPWLTSIAVSLQAGFWEECLFRAIPIAGAALIGERLGKRRLWIVGAFVVQALIFGGGHAAYPTQPAYARVVELIIPSLFFGAVYLAFGLLPSIVLHFAFDTVWFAIPLFASSASGIWVDQVAVLVLALVPLWVVLVAWRRGGRWSRIPDAVYNRAWSPPAPPAARGSVAEMGGPTAATPLLARVLPVAGVAGLVIWLVFASFESMGQGFRSGRADAVEAARGALEDDGIQLPEQWVALPGVLAAGSSDEHRFVWQESGRETYEALVGTYLEPPLWQVRFATFEGDVAERAEEYQVYLSGEGNVRRIRHRLPEARAGVDLTEEQARAVAESGVVALFPVQLQALEEVSAVSTKRPNRRDWAFTFRDPGVLSSSEGEARIRIDIAGEEIVDARRGVHVPEQWLRDDASRAAVPQLIAIGAVFVIVLMFVAGSVIAIINWSRKNLSVRVFLSFFALVFGLTALAFANGWPTTVALFSTAQPFANQVVLLVSGALLGFVVISAATALVLGWLHRWQGGKASATFATSLWMGAALGALGAGLAQMADALSPALQPLWGDVGGAGNYLPVAGPALGAINGYITSTTLLLLVVSAINHWSGSWTRRKGLFSFAFLALGLLFSALGIDTVSSWLISGLVTGVMLLLAYQFVIRFDIATIPAALAVMTILTQLQAGLQGSYPAALAGSALAIALVALLAAWWVRQLHREDRRGEVVNSVPKP